MSAVVEKAMWQKTPTDLMYVTPQTHLHLELNTTPLHLALESASMLIISDCHKKIT